MGKYNWENEEDEYIADEITLLVLLIKNTQKSRELSEKAKEFLIDECLDKLNSLYDEQRKRSTFRGNSGRV